MSVELKAQKGDTVSVHYIGKFPGGKVFDTSMEKEAKSAGLFNAARDYHPLMVEVRTKAPVAVIINRMRFDQYLAKRGVAAGVTLHTKTRVSKFEHYSNGGIGLSVKDGPGFKGEVVIDASGAGSRLPEQAVLRAPDWSHLLPGLQYEL